MAKKVIKCICLVLTIGLLVATIFCFVLPKKGKPTIIIVPGIIASTLVEGQDETPIWDPYNSEHSIKEYIDGKVGAMVIDLCTKNSQLTNDIIYGIINNSENSILKKLSANEDGVYRDNYIHAASMESSENLRYGPFLAHKDLYDNIVEEYGNSCNVTIFQYDWRKDNRESGKALEDYINEKGYNNIIFVSHSMGNTVTSQYLARSQSNRDKVKGFCSIAAPYYGSTLALSVLENLTGMIPESLYKFFDEDELMPIINEQVMPLVANLVSLQQLLPTIEYATILKEIYGSSFLTVDGKEITTQEQLTEFYCSRPWAKKSDGEIKPYVADLTEYNDSFYVEYKDKKVHASKLVNTIYFAGTNVNTVTSISIDNNHYSQTITELGDGTVPLYSTILDYNLNSRCVHIYDDYDHLTMGCKYIDPLAEDLSKTLYYMV